MSVRIGLGIAGFPFSGPDAFWRWVDQCEETGVDSIWLTERLVSPQPFLEPVSALAAIAGRTRRLKFGVNATVLPLRDPLIIAKELATIDYLSNGRLLPVYGVGNDLAPEWQATGAARESRGRRANEMLELLTRLWSEDAVSYEGRFYRYEAVTINPKPKQTPLPMWIGGSSEAAIERTARYGTGWLAGAAQGPRQVGGVIASIRERSAALGRPIDDEHYGVGLGYRFGSEDEPVVQRSLHAVAARAPGVDPRSLVAVGDAKTIAERVQAYVEAGASKFVLRPIAATDEEMLDQSRRLAAEVSPLVET